MKRERNTVTIILFNLDALAAGMALILAVLVMSANVVMRLFFRGPLSGAEEVALGLFVWAVFLGGAYVYRRHANLDAYIVVNMLSPGSRFLVKLTIDFLVILSLAALTYAGGLCVSHTMGEVSVVLGIPVWYVVGAAPFGFGLSFVYALYFFLHDLLTIDNGKGGAR